MSASVSTSTPAPMVRPALDPDLAAVHRGIPTLDVGTDEERAAYREFLHTIFTLQNTLRGKEETVVSEERDIPGPAGPMRATIFRPKHQTHSVDEIPGVLHIHGGGLSSGNRYLGLTVLDWVETLGAVVVTAEYRLAPEHPHPAPLEDSYAALQWMSAHAAELGFSPRNLVVTGGSAGGNLAAGVALLARDRQGPTLRGQVLMYPWLDDRTDWPSVHQYGDIAPVTEADLLDASTLAFGANHEHADLYTAPTRAPDLSGLPPTFLDVGAADVFRDQDLAYAAALWRDGVATELHVWPGAWHGFDVFAPDAPISRRAGAARLDWMRRLFSSDRA
ncbi:alpha/beta hydrolase fold protein [Aspergillus heteromorphus CBS 117.55]|uniref:Alpha/beta hydrolase fold protein n=1 Tax=Aspergillus heteromorphus CBS 117.55 TaxID=1448321 RepID=A0A317UVD5_9EURO|nr:alpha/beta hydrolase fold protein [Aspergillus heteromorphus CBS 117.55]PWY66023.1 alpha/beta hydrolase fold protein [Aspergillus heteromorphus CBS 117.55]